MSKSVFESIVKAREILIDMANSYIKNQENPILCSVCNEEIKVTYDESVVKQEWYVSTIQVSPPFVKFHIHQDCEQNAIKNESKQFEQEKREKLKKAKEIAFSKFVKSLDFPNAESVDIDVIQNIDLTAAWSMEDDFGFIIRGHAGTGKSYLAVAIAKKIAKAIINSKTVDDLSGDPIGNPILEVYGLPVFIKANEFYETTIDNGYKIKGYIKNAKYLFLDDVGTENITDFKREMFYNLIDHRSASKLPTFITTNLSLDQIKERFYERVSSRILGMCVPIEMNGVDRRLVNVKNRINTLRGRLGI